MPSRARQPPTAFAVAYTWSACLAFAASATGFLYFYGVSLGQVASPRIPAVREAWLPIVWNVGVFTLFALHHSVLARPAAKRWVTAWLSPRFERSSYVWIASLLLVLVCRAWTRVDGLVWQLTGPAIWLAHALQVVGAILFLLAARRIDVRELVGLRQAAASIESAPPGGPGSFELRVDGPYRLVRHPLYLGIILLAWGTARMTLDRLVLTACLTIYILLAVPWEERALRAQHGEPYRRYAGRVRWRVIPGLY